MRPEEFQHQRYSSDISPLKQWTSSVHIMAISRMMSSLVWLHHCFFISLLILTSCNVNSRNFKVRRHLSLIRILVYLPKLNGGVCRSLQCCALNASVKISCDQSLNLHPLTLKMVIKGAASLMRGRRGKKSLVWNGDFISVNENTCFCVWVNIFLLITCLLTNFGHAW